MVHEWYEPEDSVRAGLPDGKACLCDPRATSVLHHDRPRTLRRVAVLSQLRQRHGDLGIPPIYRLVCGGAPPPSRALLSTLDRQPRYSMGRKS